MAKSRVRYPPDDREHCSDRAALERPRVFGKN